MRKNKLTITERKRALKRGAKRSDRLRKTQKEKHIKKARLLAEKKTKKEKEDKKFREEMDKLLQSRFAK